MFKSLLDEPNPNSPANSLAAQLYSENRREYEKRVNQIVEESWISEDLGLAEPATSGKAAPSSTASATAAVSGPEAAAAATVAMAAADAATNANQATQSMEATGTTAQATANPGQN